MTVVTSPTRALRHAARHAPPHHHPCRPFLAAGRAGDGVGHQRRVGRSVGLRAGQDAMNGPPRAAQARADGPRRPSAQSGRDTCAQASAWHGPPKAPSFFTLPMTDCPPSFTWKCSTRTNCKKPNAHRRAGEQRERYKRKFGGALGFLRPDFLWFSMTESVKVGIKNSFPEFFWAFSPEQRLAAAKLP